MEKFTRYSLILLKWILLVFVSIWIGLALFFYFEKENLVRQVSEKIKEQTQGDVHIGNLSGAFLRNFPFLSIEISDITLRDSLWKFHHQDFLKVQKIYIRLSLFTLLSGHLRISKLIVENGQVHVFTDSLGYSNDYLFKRKNSGEKKEETYPAIVLKQVLVLYTNLQRNKAFGVFNKRTTIEFDNKGSYVMGSIKLNSVVRDLAFNTVKGSFLKDKTLAGDLRLVFQKTKKELLFSNTVLRIDNHPFDFKGVFSLDSSSRQFSLFIKTNKIPYSQAVSLLTEKLKGKLAMYTAEKPLDLEAEISGRMQKGYKPKITVRAMATDNTITTSIGTFAHCDFVGWYNNMQDPALPGTDENSILEFTAFKGHWEGLPLHSKRITISNLKNPFLKCDLQSNFDMTSLNRLAGSNTLQFEEGKANLDVIFKGPVFNGDSSSASIVGDCSIKEGKLKYLPRNITLSNCTGTVHFKDKILQVERLNALIGHSTVIMNGSIDNFLSLLKVSPEKISMNWNVYSPHLMLEDFDAFLARQSSSAGKQPRAKFGNVSSRVDRMFIDGDVTLNLESPEVNYKKFEATQVSARVLLKPSQLIFENINFHHAGGSVAMSGSLQNERSSNSLKLQTNLNKLRIPVLFNAFNDFGQDALTRKNLDGVLTATVHLQTSISNKAEMNRDQTSGTIDFLIEEGELNHFEPLEKIQQTAFKKQNFSEVRFADLKNNLEIRGTAFIIKKMEIRSTALTMYVEGVFDTRKGTNMSIQLPVRNLLRNNEETDLTDSGKRRKGISIRLKAQTGEDGKLKVSWDPFKKALKEIKE